MIAKLFYFPVAIGWVSCWLVNAGHPLLSILVFVIASFFWESWCKSKFGKAAFIENILYIFKSNPGKTNGDSK